MPGVGGAVGNGDAAAKIGGVLRFTRQHAIYISRFHQTGFGRLPANRAMASALVATDCPSRICCRANFNIEILHQVPGGLTVPAHQT